MRTPLPRPALVGLLLSLAACAPAHVTTTPAPTPIAGNRIRYAIRPDSNYFVVARVLSFDADSLIFERFIPGDPGRWVRGSIATDSIARLQVRVGRRGNGGRGALVGGAVGVVLGALCASETSGSWVVSPESCFLGYAVLGAGTGLLIGTFRRSDVWAPASPPARRPPLVSSGAPLSTPPSGVGLRIGVRVPGP